MKGTVTVRLDARLRRQLERAARLLGRTRSDLVRGALRRQLALLSFERNRRRLLPYAAAAGILRDEDVFRRIS